KLEPCPRGIPVLALSAQSLWLRVPSLCSHPRPEFPGLIHAGKLLQPCTFLFSTLMSFDSVQGKSGMTGENSPCNRTLSISYAPHTVNSGVLAAVWDYHGARNIFVECRQFCAMSFREFYKMPLKFLLDP